MLLALGLACGGIVSLVVFVVAYRLGRGHGEDAAFRVAADVTAQALARMGAIGDMVAREIARELELDRARVVTRDPRLGAGPEDPSPTSN